MGECENLATCPFFNDRLPNMPATTTFLKSFYCQREYTKCARYIVSKALGSPQVPADLFPEESIRAERIVAGKRR